MIYALIIGTGLVAVPTLSWLAWTYWPRKELSLKEKVLKEASKQERMERHKSKLQMQENQRLSAAEEQRKIEPKTHRPKNERELLRDIRMILFFLVLFVYLSMMLTSCVTLYTIRTVSPFEMLHNDIQRIQRNNR